MNGSVLCWPSLCKYIRSLLPGDVYINKHNAQDSGHFVVLLTKKIVKCITIYLLKHNRLRIL